VWDSILEDLWITNFTTGSGILMIGNATVGGSYYNELRKIRLGKSGEANSYGIKLDTDDAGAARVNANRLVNITGQHNTNDAIYLNITSGNVIDGCTLEQNGASGINANVATDLTILGGYGENNTTADLSVGLSSTGIKLFGMDCNSSTKITGAGVSNTGNLYFFGNNTTGLGDYQQWARSMAIRALWARDLEFIDKASSSGVLWGKFSGDSGYRMRLSNDGRKALSATGDSVYQVNKDVVVSVQTTGNTATALTTVTLGEDDVISIKALVVATDAADGGTNNAGYMVHATARRDGGTAALIGTPTAIATNEGTGTMDCTFDCSGSTIRLMVTGVAATTINWVATLDWVTN
jgi:hypothetical protein